MNNFTPFDPLKAKSVMDTEVAALAQKREIKNILGSYVGWYDPFCELIQNGLDAIEERTQLENPENNYLPQLWITVNIKDNSLMVTDNGIGLNEEKFTKFLCPDISFKSGKTRGHKGVGATYLAYGFNHIQVATRVGKYIAIGKMEGARKWLDDENPTGNPQMKPDDRNAIDPVFNSLDNGVSIYVKFDNSTHPKDLKWIQSEKAEQWLKILKVKTGLGAFFPNKDVTINLKVIDRNGNETEVVKKGIEYFWPQLALQKTSTITEINNKRDELYQKGRDPRDLPGKFKNLDAFYQSWSDIDLINLYKNNQISFDDEDIEIINKLKPCVNISYVYSLKVWEAIHSELDYRQGQKVLYGGIQICANNMPQGETIQIPLNRNIGRQNQIHCVIHFNNCSADLGRKGFKSEIVEFSKDLAKKLSDGPLLKIKYALRINTGSAPNLLREQEVENWKKEMAEYEINSPLELISEHFFLPAKKISITSKPTREQDVIALFNQLIAGGVIRGIKIMSTNERLTYDGLFRILLEEPTENHLYDEFKNPLGIEKSILKGFPLPFKSDPKVLEYKFSLDGLIEDIDAGNKNSNDISLVIVWETGEMYKENYKLTSFLDPDNLNMREFHGVTHSITNITTGQREIELIVLSELIEFLNNPEETIKKQIEKYEE
jgi:hypothetical protein